MNRTVQKAILGVLAALLVLSPLASATAVYRTTSDTETGCGNTCAVTVYHTVDSSSSLGDCFGTAGAYTACAVYHSCEATFSGVLLTGTVHCYSDFSTGTSDGCNTLTTTVCTAYAPYDYAIVPRSVCGWFYAYAYLVSPTGTVYAEAPALRVCVNVNGPY